jgi:hypothetical protein
VLESSSLSEEMRCGRRGARGGGCRLGAMGTLSFRASGWMIRGKRGRVSGTVGGTLSFGVLGIAGTVNSCASGRSEGITVDSVCGLECADRSGTQMLDNNVVTSRRACDWVSVRGANGVWGLGFLRACTISRRQATMVSVEELDGILTWVGIQVKVSLIRARRVSHSQVVWQRYESRAGPM